jgi:DNA-binding response OmpR family regulator
MMPKMNGFDVCKTVKHEGGMDVVYFIMLTAKGQEFDKDIGNEVGADLYMTKPFNPDEIMAHAIRVLNIEVD